MNQRFSGAKSVLNPTAAITAVANNKIIFFEGFLITELLI